MPSAKYLTLERALLAALGAAVGVRALPASPNALSLVADGVIVCLLLAHHRRQQLLFAYIATVAELLSTILLLVSSTSYYNHYYYPLLRGLAIGGAALGVVGAIVFPLPDFTALHGPFQTIGCHTMRLGGVECRVFYPSTRGASRLDAKRHVPYVHHGEDLTRALSIVGKAPQWFFNTLHSAYLSAIQDAPVSASPSGWPLVIFSHGLGGSLEIYATIVQEIASHGHVVVVVNHCDGSASVTRHPDGRIQLFQTVTPEETADLNGEGFRFRNRQLAQRVQELRSALDEISRLNTERHPVFGAVNLSSVHVAGHSFGAATALSVAHEDARFRSAVLHDAWMMPVAERHRDGLGDRAPVLHLISEQFLLLRKENVEAIKRHARGCCHRQSDLRALRQSHHNDFTDLPQFSPLVTRMIGAAGKIEPRYAGISIGRLSASFVRGDFAHEVHRVPSIVQVQ